METLRVGAEQLRRQLTELLNRVGYGGDHVVVERNGRPIAVLLPYEIYQQQLDQLQAGMERVLALASALEEAREAAGVPYEALANQLHSERLRTLHEKYPDFAAEFTNADASAEPAWGLR